MARRRVFLKKGRAFLEHYSLPSLAPFCGGVVPNGNEKIMRNVWAFIVNLAPRPVVIVRCLGLDDHLRA